MDSSNLGKALVNRMSTRFTSMNESRNVVLLKLKKLSDEQLLYVLAQYLHFPRRIVSVLTSAVYTFGYHGWHEIVDELRDNVWQELGGGLGMTTSPFGPHYSTVRREVEHILDVDLNESSSSFATTTFLNQVDELVQLEPFMAAGSVVALEASAIPELLIVRRLVDQLATIRGKVLTRDLVLFFEFHVNQIEVGHRDRLIALCDSRLRDSPSLDAFVLGFDTLLLAMDDWWASLAREAESDGIVRQSEVTIGVAVS